MGRDGVLGKGFNGGGDRPIGDLVLSLDQALSRVGHISVREKEGGLHLGGGIGGKVLHIPHESHLLLFILGNLLGEGGDRVGENGRNHNGLLVIGGQGFLKGNGGNMVLPIDRRWKEKDGEPMGR